jgi:hypothetical protein
MNSSIKNQLHAKFAGLASSAAGKLSFKERDVSFLHIFCLLILTEAFNLFVAVYRTIQTTNKCQHSY